MSLVEYSVEGAVAVLTLNRPPVNALSAALAADLEAAMARAADPAVRAVVVTGSPHFAAGADIGELKAAAEAEDDTPLASHLSTALLALENLPKPVDRRRPRLRPRRGTGTGPGLRLPLPGRGRPGGPPRDQAGHLPRRRGHAAAAAPGRAGAGPGR